MPVRAGRKSRPLTAWAQESRDSRLRRYHDHGGLPDPYLVAFLEPLGLVDTAPVQPGAVGRIEVLDVPETVSELEKGVVARGPLVAEDQ